MHGNDLFDSHGHEMSELRPLQELVSRVFFVTCKHSRPTAQSERVDMDSVAESHGVDVNQM